MKKAGTFIEKLSDKTVKIMIFIITGILAFWAARYTYFYPADYSIERVYIEPDSVWKNILVFGIVLLITYGLQMVVLRGNEQSRRKKVFVFAMVDLILVGILLIWFVANTHIPPYWDQAQVYLDALSFKAGDYTDMDNYLKMYPQQYGLIFMYEFVFLFTKDSYIVLEYLNVIFVLMIIFFSYRISEELFHSQTVNFYCILGTTLFMPMYIYVNFVYGDLASTAFAIVGIWAVLKWREKSRLLYMTAAIPAFIVAYLFRKNTLIILIAVLLAMLIDAFKKKNWKAAVLGLLVLILPMISMEGIKISYEIRSGKEISGGIPAVMWMAMGMQEDYKGCGVFNGYTESYFRGPAQSDSAKASQIAREYMSDRAKEFRNNPEMAKNFYKTKIQSQWIEPTFSSLIMTSKFGEDPTEFTKSFYFENAAAWLIKFMNYYNFILYAGAVCYALTALFKKDSILHSIGLIAVIGGFLFSIIWEAKGRYVMPYVILLLPYMAQGIYGLQMYLKSGCNLRK